MLCTSIATTANSTGVFTANLGPYFAVNLLLGTEDIGKLGLRVEAGAKLQVTADINLDDPEAVDEVSTALYDRLSVDSSIKIGPYGQVGYNWKFLGEFEDEDNFWEYDPGWEFDGGLVPRFYRTNVYTSDASTGSITVESNVDGYVFIFTTGTLGFALFDDKGKEVARIFDTRNYLDPLLWNYYSLTFTGIEYNKWYTVHPVCHLMGHELIASPGVKFFAGERDLLVDPMSLEFDFNGGTKFISVKNSFSDETHYILENLPDDWLTVEQTEGGYNITVKPNETTKRRQTTITFTAADPNNPFNTRQREVVIKQDIDPELIGLLMQNYDITSETDDSDWPDFWVWTPYATEEEPNGRWDLFGLLPRNGKEDIEDAFKRNPKIKPNDDGTFKLEGEGLTIEGKFDPAPDGERYRTGSGTFTLSTDMQHHRKSKEDVEEMLHRGPNNGDIQDFIEFVNPALDEHYKRSVEGNIYISWSEHKQQYEFNFIGHGSVTYDAECYWEFRGLDPSFTESGTNVFYTAHPNATLGETKFVSVTCNNSIDCNVDYELVE